MYKLHPFPIGTKVQTNKEYFRNFGRKVIGESIAFNPMPPKEITIVRWEHQEGNVISEQQGKAVLMMSKDLEKYVMQ